VTSNRESVHQEIGDSVDKRFGAYALRYSKARNPNERKSHKAEVLGTRSCGLGA
jgi:hypothetical protein